ncbi:MAG TPA: hypothetical protein VGR28_08685 [Candidatus Thermoplasmatota archaeon]|jgi:hypothetical protein|nr:hypothetical protein [Candidatus Thermoplasmatota archaeon]
MLGDKVGELKGKVVNIRVLEPDAEGPSVEVTMQETGTLFGVDVQTVVTYVSRARPGGILTGQGNGVLFTPDGESLTWRGLGIGTPKGKGQAASWRGGIVYHGSSRKLERLNKVSIVYEYEIDEAGNSHGKLTEWK